MRLYMNFKLNTEQRRKRKIVSFNELLNDIIHDLNIQNESLVFTLKEDWNNIVGRIMSVHSTPDRIFKKTLFISVDHPVYANEIMMMKNTILQKIDDTIGGGIIKTMKVETKRLNGKANVYTSRRK